MLPRLHLEPHEQLEGHKGELNAPVTISFGASDGLERIGDHLVQEQHLEHFN